MNYRRRIDANHARLLSTLRKLGWEVWDSHAIPGFVDAVIYRAGMLRLIEIKTDDGKLTPAQQDLHRRFPVVILRSLDDCLKLR